MAVPKILRSFRNSSVIKKLYTWYLYHFGRNHYTVKRSNRFNCNGAILKHCEINILGRNNIVEIWGGRLTKCTFSIFGNNCKIKIGTKNTLNCVQFWIEDNNSEICIGHHNTFTGKLQLAVIEGTKIIIGDNNLFSSEINIVTGDSHSILDLDGHRINPSKDIRIGNHNWIGNKVTIAKGVTILDDTIVGRHSLVLKPCDKCSVAIAGVPAKVVKEGINWDIDRV